MRIIGDDEGINLYFKGEIEINLLLSLLQKHVNMCIKESMVNKSMFIEEREIHPTEYMARQILETLKGTE